MDEREELKKELEQELLWVQYRRKMLDIIEKKLLKMKILAEWANKKDLTSDEIEALNTKLNNLATQVIALDGESRKIKDDKIL